MALSPRQVVAQHKWPAGCGTARLPRQVVSRRPYKHLICIKWFLKRFSTVLHSQLNYHVQPDTPFKSKVTLYFVNVPLNMRNVLKLWTIQGLYLCTIAQYTLFLLYKVLMQEDGQLVYTLLYSVHAGSVFHFHMLRYTK